MTETNRVTTMQRCKFIELVQRSIPGVHHADRLINLGAKLGVTPDGPWIAGGAIRRVLLGEDIPTDVDVFFRSKEQYDEMERLLTGWGWEKTSQNDHNSVYKIAPDYWPNAPKLQLIHIDFYHSAEVLLDYFDFTICQFAFDGVDLIHGPYSLWDLGRKRLAVHRIQFPISSTRRLLKYANQGFTACNGCLSELHRQSREVRMDDDRWSIFYID